VGWQTPSSIDKKKALWKPLVLLFRVPLVCLICAFYFVFCVLLMVFVHPEHRRLDHYEYYYRWGWGRKPKRPKEHDV